MTPGPPVFPDPSRRRLRYLSVCSGIEAASVAWAHLGWEPVAFAEIDPFCNALLAYHYPGVPNFGDFRQIGADDVAQLGGIDVLVGGPPCFPAGVSILTRNGFKDISEVVVGDEVFTHHLRWRRVTATMRREADTWLVKGQGHPGLVTTDEHPFYARTSHQIWHGSTRTQSRTWTDPTWTPASEMQGRFWATPATFPACEPPPIEPFGEERTSFALTPELFWVVGAWLGDGWLRTGQRAGRPEGQTWGDVIICAAHDQAGNLKARLDAAGLHAHTSSMRTTVRFTISSRPFARWLETHFGRFSHGKRLPPWTLGLDAARRRALLDGYVWADGYKNVRQRCIQITSVNKHLLLGVKLLGISFGYAATLQAMHPNRECVIEGRTVRERPSFMLRLYEAPRSSVEIDGIRWSKVRQVGPTGRRETVFNIEVEGDNSYVADGIIVHNCQAFSIAGKRGGLDDPRGNLTLEFCRLVDRLRPRWVVYENVPGLLSSSGGRDFGILLGGLTGRIPTIPAGGWGTAGVASGTRYGAAWRVLDAQYFGVPQRRRRIFLVGHLGDWRPPVAVLFERHSMRGDSPPSRASRQSITPCLADGAGASRERPNAEHGGYPSTAGDAPVGNGRSGNRVHDVAPPVASTLGSGQGAGGWGYDLDRSTFVPAIPSTVLLDGSAPGGASVDAYPQTVGTLCASNGPNSHGTGSFTGNQAIDAGYVVPDVIGTLTCNSGPQSHDAGNFTSNTGVDGGYVIPCGVGRGDVSHTLQTNAGGPRCPTEETYILQPSEPPTPSRLIIAQNGSDIQVSDHDQTGTVTASQARQTSGDLIAEPIGFAATSRGTWAPPSPSVKVGQSPTLDTTREACVAVPVLCAQTEVAPEDHGAVFHATGSSVWQPGPGTLRAHQDAMVNLVVQPDQGTPPVAFDRYLRSEPDETAPTLRSGSFAESHQTGPAGFVPHVLAPHESLPDGADAQLQPVAFNWQASTGTTDDSFRGGSRQYIVRAGDYTGALGATRRDAVMIPMVASAEDASATGQDLDASDAAVDPALAFEPRYYSDREPGGGRPAEVTGPLRASSSGTSDSFPHILVPQPSVAEAGAEAAGDGADAEHPFTFEPRYYYRDGVGGAPADVCNALRVTPTSDSNPVVVVPSSTDVLAFSCKDYGADAGDLSPTLRACGHADSHANGGGQIAVVFQQNQRDEVRLIAEDGQIAGTLAAESGMHNQNFVAVFPAEAQAYTIQECDPNGTRPDRPDGGMYVSEAECTPALTTGRSSTHVVTSRADGADQADQLTDRNEQVGGPEAAPDIPGGTGEPMPVTVATMALRGRAGATLPELGDDIATALRASQGGADKPYVLVSPHVINGNSTPEVLSDCAMPLRADDGSGNRQVVGLVRDHPEAVCLRTGGDYADPTIVLDDQAFLAANPMSDRQMVVAVPTDGGTPIVPDSDLALQSPSAVIMSGAPARSDRPTGGLYVSDAADTAKTLDTSGSSLSSAQGGVGVLHPTFGISNQPTPKVGVDVAPSLDAKANGGGRMECVAVLGNDVATFQQSSMTGRGTLGYDSHSQVAKPVTTGADRQMLQLQYAVRRLTPEECEALQGFPRGYTRVPYRNGWAADGPRYKALGNSMATPCMAWIGEGMQMVETIALLQATLATQGMAEDIPGLFDLQAVLAADGLAVTIADLCVLLTRDVADRPHPVPWNHHRQGWTSMALSPVETQVGSVLLIPPAQIEPDPGQPRQDFGDTDQQELNESVQSTGVQTPIQVYEIAPGRYRILDGERRWRAAMATDRDTIPCVVISTPPPFIQTRTRQFLANTLQRPLTPLEDAQVMYLLWLASQVEALEKESDDDGTQTAMLLEECGPPTTQIVVLSDRLCALAGVATVDDYAASGRVRVTWQAVLESCGRGTWSADRRKKHLRILDVSERVQNALAGIVVSARTLHAIAELPAGEQEALVDQALQTAGRDGDVGAVIRAALDPTPADFAEPEEPARAPSINVAAAMHETLDADLSHRDEPGRPGTASASSAIDWENVPGADVGDDAFAAPAAERPDTFVPDRELAFPFSTGKGKPLISERGEIGRGSVPPEGHDRIPRDATLQFSSHFEAMLTLLDEVGPGYFSDDDKRLLAPLWNELVPRLQAAGLEPEE